jgi:hypothetical protein
MTVWVIVAVGKGVTRITSTVGTVFETVDVGVNSAAGLQAVSNQLIIRRDETIFVLRMKEFYIKIKMGPASGAKPILH